MLAIFKKELHTYFNTLSGYIFLGFFVLINAYFFSNFNIGGGIPTYANTLMYTLSMFLILIPVMTMRLFAEETRQKTDQLLYTSPVSIGKIVLGKFFAAAALFLIGLIIIAVFPLILSYYGDVPFAETFGCFLGYFLLGSSLISVGLFISVLTDNQIVAAVGTFAAVFFFLMMDGIIESMPMDTMSSLLFVVCVILFIAFILYNGTKSVPLSAAVFGVGLVAEACLYLYDSNFFELAVKDGFHLYNSSIFDGIIVKVLNWFSVLNRFESFYMGVFKLSDMVYYISFITVFLYITVNTIEKRRWK